MGGDLAKLTATVVGAGLCLVALTAWQLPTAGSPPGLDLRLIAIPPGELIVDPIGVVASEQGMQAGDAPIHGEMRVENIAGRPLRVRMVPLPATRDLAGKVRLRVVAGGRTIAAGSLAALEGLPGTDLRLPARGSTRVGVSAWVAPGSSGYRGQILDVTLDFRARPPGADA